MKSLLIDRLFFFLAADAPPVGIRPGFLYITGLVLLGRTAVLGSLVRLCLTLRKGSALGKRPARRNKFPQLSLVDSLTPHARLEKNSLVMRCAIHFIFTFHFPLTTSH